MKNSKSSFILIFIGLITVIFLYFFYSSNVINLYKEQILELNNRIIEKEDYDAYFTQIKDTIYYSIISIISPKF